MSEKQILKLPIEIQKAIDDNDLQSQVDLGWITKRQKAFIELNMAFKDFIEAVCIEFRFDKFLIYISKKLERFK